MAITGSPTIVKGMGGKVSQGPALGDYRCVIEDLQVGNAKTGRPKVILQLVVKDDAQHPAMNGKKLTKWDVYLPIFEAFTFTGEDGKEVDVQADDEEKILKMKGMVKRQLFDATGTKWPSEAKDLDFKILVNKALFVRYGEIPEREDKATGQKYEARSGVVAVAAKLESLPKAKAPSNNPKAGNSAVATAAKQEPTTRARR